MTINYEQKKLPNGLKLITAPWPGQAATIMVLVGVGSRDEDNQRAGISHFLEHMLFKGTKKRPTTLAISRELDQLGAQYNAFTSLEYTGYWLTVANEYFASATKILADMFLCSQLPSEEITKESGTILEEINMSYDIPQHHVEEMLHSLMYPDQPFGRPIIGCKETVKKINQADLLDYYRSRYQPQATTIILCGEDKFLPTWQKLIKSIFNFPAKGESFSRVPAEPRQTIARRSFEKRPTDQGHLEIGFPAVSATDPQSGVLEILTNALGGMMSSPLFIEIRERRGWAYHISAAAETVTDAGWLRIKSGLTLPHLQEAIDLIWRLCRQMTERPLTKEELTKAQNNWLGHFYLNLQTSQEIASFLAEESYYFSRPRQPKEIAEKIRAVTIDRVQFLAKQIFRPDNFNLSLISPHLPNLPTCLADRRDFTS